ncbi:hypothetical protein FQR65_LT18330 [Abscondita terminalis]|nr:hypothetical protein FQR65_LT18330 [Abscondita terminalis]
MQPHQREVTRILQFVAQASHELVPPDAIEPLLKTIANNFITERNSSDVMAIGLNAVREICTRCPLAMSEDLLRDLVEYKNYRDRSVMMAARSLMHVFRNTRPELLHKKDRGRPTEATQEHSSLQYAQIDAKDYISGAEVLLKEVKEDVEIDSESNSDDDEWVDIPQSDDELVSDKPDGNEKLDLQTKRELAKKKLANIQKQVDPYKKGQKRKLEETDASAKSELVQLGDIENIYKKRKHDKESRVESVRKGQADREKFGYKDGRVNIHCSKTNREKKKTKNYQMIRHKVRSKIKRSFKDKQIALRNYLVKQKRMK